MNKKKYNNNVLNIFRDAFISRISYVFLEQ